MPTNRGRMCTLTNDNVIPLRCITIEAVNTNNVLILIFIFLGHGFLKDRCSIGRQTHVRSKGISMVIYPLHEFRLRAKAASSGEHFATNDICITSRLALALKSIDGLMRKKHTPKKEVGAMPPWILAFSCENGVCQLSPFPNPPPPVFGGSIDPPPPPRK